MSYRHISNLYQQKDILMFKECYATEKIHGTSAHVSYPTKAGEIDFFAGGSSRDLFLLQFNKEALLAKFRENAAEHPEVKRITLYGESYGGKCQGMSATYGKVQKFIVFEVLIVEDEHEYWMSVPQAELIAQKFGMEFVHYKQIPTTEEAINAEMMADSVQAVRNGMGEGHMREGVVLRPLVELIHQNGGRIICKHKRAEFAERKNTPKFSDPLEEEFRQKRLEDANAIAEEWVNAVRLAHVLDALGITNPTMEDTRKVIAGMVEDVYREAKGEIVESELAVKAIGRKTAKVFKYHVQGKAFTEKPE